jgi:hypothetical protein
MNKKQESHRYDMQAQNPNLEHHSSLVSALNGRHVSLEWESTLELLASPASTTGHAARHTAHAAERTATARL